MIKLPSFQALKTSLFQTIFRFKWVVLVALVKLILTICLVETSHEGEATQNLLTRLSFVFFLSLPLVLAIELLAERRQWKSSLKMGILISLVGLLICYYFSISLKPNLTDQYRFALFIAAAHLIVSFAPFLKYDEPNGFWQFNKALFLQFLNATLYAATLFVGILIAISTIKYLFGIRFLFEIEADTFLLLSQFFHTIFFLSKVPEKLESLEQQISYPSGLKIFTQYVLLPLVVIYLLILYTYSGKILFQWQLPEGGVAYLVLAFSTAGMLALLLLYPLRDTLQDRWVSLFSHRFYLALLPLIVLLLTGIFHRINEYGITENRYLVAILAFWLAGITLYFLIVKPSDIRWIPITLAIISFTSAVGPWNIFKISERSQLTQFHTILVENKLLNAQNHITGEVKLSSKDYNQLFSVADFFRDRENPALDTYFSPPPQHSDTHKPYNGVETLLRNHVSSEISGTYDSYLNYTADIANPKTINIQGYNFLLAFDGNAAAPAKDKEWKIVPENKSEVLTVYRNNQKIVSFDLKTKISELNKKFGDNSGQVPQELMILDHQDANNPLKIILQSISGNKGKYVTHGYLLYKN